jgi:surface protein
MFYGCTSLTSLDLSNFDTSKIEDMSHMFFSCSSLTSLDLSSFDFDNVFNMYCMFYRCSSLESLTVNTNVSLVSETSNMFADVSTSGTLYTNSSNNIFAKNVPSTWTVEVPNYITLEIKKSTNAVFIYDSRYIFISDYITKITVNGEEIEKTNYLSSFPNDSNTVVIHFNKFNEGTSLYNMFYNCPHITSIDLSNFNTSNVTSMNSMFKECKALTSLNLSNLDTSNVTDMSAMFANSTLLTSLDLSSFDFSKATKTYNMFYGCTSLVSLTVNTDITSVSSSSNMFTNVGSNGILYTNSSTNIFAVNKPSTWSISLI